MSIPVKFRTGISFGACCDRCSKSYLTPNWPAASLCPACDVDNTTGVWVYRPGRLVKTAEEILRTA